VNSVLPAITRDPLQLACHFTACFQVGDQVIQRYDAGDWQLQLLLHLLHGRTLAATAFHAVQRDHHTAGTSAGSTYELDRFSHRRSCGNDIVHNQRAPGERCADDHSAFAVILGLLAVKRDRHVATCFGQGDRGSGNQGNPLVGWPEQLVERDAGVQNRVGVESPEPLQRSAVVEQTRVEEIRRGAPRLGGERPEAQYVTLQGERDEVVTKAQTRFPLRIITLNLNGLRSAVNKGLLRWLRRQNADVVCLQELKAQHADLTDAVCNPTPLKGYFHCADKKGYSGVGLYCAQTPDRVVSGLGIADIDAEGRYLEAQFGALSVVSFYLPSGSSSEERLAVKFSFLERVIPRLHALASGGSEVIICGDWNIAHREIDLKNWRSNQKNSGFLPEERAWLSDVFERLGYVDVFRRIDPRAEQYTWWSNRGQAWAKNVGWRIDYQIATPGIAAKAVKAVIYKAKRFSDHAPLIIDYDYEFHDS